MSTIILRNVKLAQLTNTELDANFTNLNTDKWQVGGTYSAGSANAVAFLNASKVLTTGSALTFDGTNLFNTQNTASPIGIRLNNSSASTSAGARISFEFGGSTTGYVLNQFDGGDFNNKYQANQYHIWLNTASETMRLTSTGLGIGTSSPGAALHVQRSSANAVFRLSSSGGSGRDWDIKSQTDGYLTIGSDLLAGQLNLSAGNLGLGVTPSAWAGSVRALETATGAFYSYASGSVSNFYNLTNAYLNGSGNPIYKQSSYATQYLQTAGQHQWYNAPSGTAGAAITFTQAMTLDASGNLLVGTTSAITGSKLVVGGGDANIYGLTVGRGAGALTTNTAVGYQASSSVTTGDNNTAVGYQAASTNTTGTRLTAIGLQAALGGAGSAPSYSVAVGSYALKSITTGTANTAVGDNSMSLTTTGANNTAVGQSALYANTASNNTALGGSALSSNTTAGNNTAVGYQAGYANTTGVITAVGYQAGLSNTTGGVAAFGASAAKLVTTATSITAIGNGALAYTTTGSYNTAVGSGDATTYPPLFFNTTGVHNIAIGAQSLYTSTTGGYNLAIGDYALQASGTASNNTAVGYTAGYATTGGQNTFIGDSAGYNVTSGTKNTILGRFNGNQGTPNLDIRTANNFIVLSDGDGNPRGIFDGSGNLGLGVTPSAWSAYKVFQIGSSTALYSDSSSNELGLVQNAYYSSGWKYGVTGAPASWNYQYRGQTIWSNAPSGTAGAAITFTQAMTLDAGGNIALGTSTANSGVRLNVVGTDNASGTWSCMFSSASTSNKFGVRNDGYIYAAGAYNTTTAAAANTVLAADGYMYRSTSSIKYKRDVQDYIRGIADVMKLRPVTYKGKAECDGEQIFAGLIAEEVEEAGLNEFVVRAADGTADALAYQNMIALAFKAIQEQQALIESLTARLAAAGI